MADNFSIKDIENAADAHQTATVKEVLNSDYLSSSPQQFSAIVKQMENDGKARVEQGVDGAINKVNLKDGYFEFAGGMLETKVFDKNDYSTENGTASHLGSLMLGGGFNRVFAGAFRAPEQSDK